MEKAMLPFHQKSASRRLIRFFDVPITELVDWTLRIYGLAQLSRGLAGAMFRRIMRWWRKPKHKPDVIIITPEPAVARMSVGQPTVIIKNQDGTIITKSGYGNSG